MWVSILRRAGLYEPLKARRGTRWRSAVSGEAFDVVSAVDTSLSRAVEILLNILPEPTTGLPQGRRKSFVHEYFALRLRPQQGGAFVWEEAASFGRGRHPAAFTPVRNKKTGNQEWRVGNDEQLDQRR